MPTTITGPNKRLPVKLRCRWAKGNHEGIEGQVWICPDCKCWTANPDKSICDAKNRRKPGRTGRRFTD